REILLFGLVRLCGSLRGDRTVKTRVGARDGERGVAPPAGIALAGRARACKREPARWHGTVRRHCSVSRSPPRPFRTRMQLQRPASSNRKATPGGGLSV